MSSLQLLSNGRYRVLLSGRGGGGSFWGNIALTRWSQDGTRDAEGLFLYIRDLDSGMLWSAGVQPVGHTPARYQSRSGPGRAEIVREDAGIESRLAVLVATDRDVEYRALTIVNRSARRRRLDVTSYLEVALNQPAADAGHPAFSKLFVQTAYDGGSQTLLARRRPRSPEEPWLWMAHALWVLNDSVPTPPQYETDRSRFLGRGRSPANPVALLPPQGLSGTTGNVLDPVLAMRRELVLAPGQQATLVALLTAGTDEAAVRTAVGRGVAEGINATSHANAADRRVQLAEALPARWRQRLPRLTGALHHGRPPRMPGVSLPAASPLVPGDLRALGLAGTVPLVLAEVASAADLADLQQLAGVVAWWRESGIPVDFLILRPAGLDITGVGALDRASGADQTVVRLAEELTADQRDLVRRVARLTLDQARAADGAVSVPAVGARYAPVDRTRATRPWRMRQDPLKQFNGTGGFSADGSEYVIRLPGGRKELALPPLPWTNVIANEGTGFIASERGLANSWSANSRENRLTPWSNDPVTDPPAEAVYIRCEESRTFWTPTPAPVQGCGDYEVRHGFGSTTWTHAYDGLRQELTAFVPRHDGVKLMRLRLSNEGARPRALSVLSYAELLLGVLPQDAARLVVTEHDQHSGALLAMNPHRGEFAGRVAVAALIGPGGSASEWTADRARFLGRGGDLRQPRGVTSAEELDRQAGAGFDPCAAFRINLELAPGASIECLILLGEADNRSAALALVERYRDPAAVEEALGTVRGFWRGLVEGVQVETPSPALDLMLNGWLTYQNLSCRVWGRSAFYQSGGAYGFRDQLQDAAALIHLDPGLTRTQILRHAAHQFVEGDVLHWWHPPLDKGIRTRFSDDLLWLPMFTAEYIDHTGDTGILEEQIPFVEARALQRGEDEVFLIPTDSGQSGDLYDHCCRALDRSLTRGAHGLPLMGTGDWNDGMNRVGREGRGESVWLGFFLYQILEEFLPLAERREDHARVDRYRAYRQALGTALNAGGWDGGWYRRAYYDNGAVLGSAESDECQIDAIAQAWAVLSGAAPTDRAAKALAAAERYLVDEPAGIIRLLTPAFDQTPNDPGYIKGYLPGVRENGGQYTHGALWLVRALAEAGHRDRAATLLTMLSPVSRTRSAAAVNIYQAEPYVIAADVYGVAPHLGRGGWTWYTGSAGWMFRVGIESILGVTMEDGARLRLQPCLPPDWPTARLTYRLPGTSTTYRISYTQPRKLGATSTAELDGKPLEIRDGAVIVPLSRGTGQHEVTVTIGKDLVPEYHER